MTVEVTFCVKFPVEFLNSVEHIRGCTLETGDNSVTVLDQLERPVKVLSDASLIITSSYFEHGNNILRSSFL